MKVNALVASGLIAFCGAVSAEQGSRGRLAFDIQSKGLEAALTDFALATNLQVLFLSDIVPDRPVSPVSGKLTPEAALNQLLAGSGLAYQFVNDKTVTIRYAEAAPLPTGLSTNGAEAGAADSIRLAQAASPAKSASPDEQSTGPDYRVVGIPEVLVKGSRALNMDIRRTEDDIQPYVVFDREAIENSGTTNLDAFLKARLPSATNASSPGQSADGNSSAINLRGLGTNQTLILIDGHRAAGANLGGVPQQPDLNGIPLAAVERIEVLPATASGIYGGGATGGVINVILRRDYAGVEAQVTYGNSFEDGGANQRIDVSSGFNLEGGKTNVLIAGSYSKAGPLLFGDRPYAEDARATTLANNRAFFFGTNVAPPLGATTNIRSNATAVGGVRPNLTLKGSNVPLGSPYTFVPAGYAGSASDGGAALVANAGQYNLALADTAQGAGASLLNEPRVESLMATVRRSFGERLSGFLELSASNNSGYFRTNRANATYNIPANAANNPFNQAITVTTPIFGADATSVSTIYNRRALGGLIYQLTDSWTIEADYTWNRVRSYSRSPNGITAAGGMAITSGQIDVLRDTNQFPVDFSAYAEPDSIAEPSHSILKDASLRLAGSLFDLPAGPVVLSTLASYRDEAFDSMVITSATQPTYIPDRSQSAKSVYIELKIPIFSAANRIAGLEQLEVQAAGRHDDYSIEGASSRTSLTQPVTRFTNDLTSTDPTLGLLWKPVRDVMLRMSYGTGFLPPGVTQVVPGITSSLPGSVTALLPIRDSRRGNERLGAISIASGGTPGLRPEESESRSAGIVLTPRLIDGFRVSVDWTKIEKTDGFTSLSLNQATLDNELLIPGLVVRAAAAPGDPFGVGPIQEFNYLRTFNIAKLNVEAYDVGVNYRLNPARIGSFEFDVNATRLTHLQTQLTPIAPLVENLGVSNTTVNTGNIGGGLRWKGNAAVNWNLRSWSAGWVTNYFDSYWVNLDHSVNLNQGAARIPNQIFHDAYVGWSAPSNTSGVFEKTRVRIGATNVFNSKPAQDLVGVSQTNPRGYSYWADARRATYYVTLSKQF